VKEQRNAQNIEERVIQGVLQLIYIKIYKKSHLIILIIHKFGLYWAYLK